MKDENLKIIRKDCYPAKIYDLIITAYLLIEKNLSVQTEHHALCNL